MSFRTAVNQIPELTGAWQSGLQALKEVDRNRLEVANTRHLNGSVDIDTALLHVCPTDPRWDYAVAYRQSPEEMVYWIEVHPATQGEIEVLLRKLEWLKRWLRSNASQLDRFRREFIWVSSDRTSFTQSSPQARRLAAAGLRSVGRRLHIG